MMKRNERLVFNGNISTCTPPTKDGQGTLPQKTPPNIFPKNISVTTKITKNYDERVCIILTICPKTTIQNTWNYRKAGWQSRLVQNAFEKRAHHPEEGLIGEALVLLDGGENTEDEAHEDRHKPGNKVSQ